LTKAKSASRAPRRSKSEIPKKESEIQKPEILKTKKYNTQHIRGQFTNEVYPSLRENTIILADTELRIDPDDIYVVFGDEVMGQYILDMDFNYIPYAQQILVNALIQRTKEIPITFHPDVVYSLTQDKENSLYYKKTPNEVSALLMKEGTKNITRDKEAVLLRQKQDTSAQAIRNKRSTAVRFAVQLGYDRTFVKTVLATLVEETDTGILSLEPKRICAYIDDRIRSDANTKTLEERKGNKNMGANQAKPTKKLNRLHN